MAETESLNKILPLSIVSLVIIIIYIPYYLHLVKKSNMGIRILGILPLIILNLSSVILNSLNAKDLDNQTKKLMAQGMTKDDKPVKDRNTESTKNIAFAVLSIFSGIIFPIVCIFWEKLSGTN
jgi:hypothetical protein